jgi:hypothetical protein
LLNVMYGIIRPTIDEGTKFKCAWTNMDPYEAN